MTRAPLVAFVIALALAAPAVALAGPPDDAATREKQQSARAHFEEGQALYVGGKYAEALLEFQQGYAAFPLPGFLVNIGNCHRHLGDTVAARGAYQRFLAEAPRSPLAAEVEGLLRSLPAEAAPGTASPGPATPPAAEPGQPAAVITVAAPAPRLAPAAPRLAPAVPAARAQTAPTAAVDLSSSSPRDAGARPHASRRWWIWGAVSAALLAGTVTVLATRGDSTVIVHDGTLGTLRR